jgi:RNA polymerase sigma-54 factor
MALSPKLELRQSQTLVMTPQLQQAIKLLQLSNVELSGFVEQELERNPLLERGDATPETAPSEPSEAAEMNGAARDDATVALDRIDPSASADPVGPLDADYSNVFDSDGPAGPGGGEAAGELGLSNWTRGRGAGPGFDGDEFGLEQTLTRGVSLKEHLTEQLHVALGDPADRLIGAHLIECLDEAGWLQEDLDEAALRLGCGRDQVEKVLTMLQACEPAGVFARSLKECLALQLKELDRLDPAMQALLDNLELLARRDLEALVKVCGVDAEDVREMIAEVRALNPKPGLAYNYEVAQPVIPDVFVRENRDGGWLVELNSDTLPRVLLDQRYFARISSKAKSKEERAYLNDCMNTANWLVKSLDQRARTILKVSSEIVRQQDGFLAKGVHHLRPLNLRAIAEAISMHESTVSRVTANKYMATPRGIFELKYFFTSAINATDGGDAHSAEAVRQRIRELIDVENQKQVLSDDRLVELLAADGIDIARRTVAKYREALGIPSSVERRRLKRSTM